MKENFIKQFEQFYRMFADIVKEYDDEAWYNMGHKLTTAYKLAFHILDATKFYMQDESWYELENGEKIPQMEPEQETPKLTRADIFKNITIQKEAIINWVNKIDLEAKNKERNWTGADLESVVIFIIRHNHFHLGELNALLNEYKKGDAKDILFIE